MIASCPAVWQSTMVDGVGELRAVLPLAFAFPSGRPQPINAMHAKIASAQNNAIDVETNLVILFSCSIYLGDHREQTEPRLLAKADGASIVKPGEPGRCVKVLPPLSDRRSSSLH